ncbi:MAG: tRNA lysidine(34) synthetase TilS [Chitinophagaceae bacterium]|nr:tRNA lysidine(34) synthetase TilS [Chitinophagaceae bacterium]
MSLLDRFQHNIRQQHLFSPKDKLLLAVSGGVDSVVLCELCKQAEYDFIIAHCNFQLRGEESERDEQFVRMLGEKYRTEVLVKKFETEKYAADHKLSIQEAARELRYTWFEELVNNLLATENSRSKETPTHHSPLTIHLLTAHHADDNNETLLMNFFRGTGLHGLTGIPVKTGHIRRPLLIFSKEDLIAFAKENKLDFVEDSSNLSSKYTRNYFRNEIIPAISKVYPQVKENLQDNIERFKEIEKLYKVSVGGIRKKLCKQKGNEIHIPVRQLMGYNNKALVYEIISGYGFSEKQVDEVIRLAESESGRYISSPDTTYRIIKHRHWFIISPVIAVESENSIIEESEKQIQFAGGTLLLEITGNQEPVTNNYTACLDAKTISFPLLLRKWKAGDYFYPLGMKKKKKLARFFIDQKLSKADKEKIWVLEMNNKIIWVVGHRIDDRVKITAATKKVLKIRFINHLQTE